MNRTDWVKAGEPTPHPTLGRGYCFYTNNCSMAMATVPRLRMLELKIDQTYFFCDRT